jgi:putative membrane protein
MRAVALSLLASCALAACTTNTNSADMAPPAAMAGDPSNPLSAAGYMAMAASSDQFEIQSSQLALQVSTNPAVQGYGRMLIAHHQATTANLIQAAQSAGLPPPPPTLLPMHQTMLDQLRAAGTGPAFDQAYKTIQIPAHEQALALHTNYASGGDVPALRQVAAAAAPIVQQHLVGAQNLNVMAMQQMQQPMEQAPATAPVRSGERG